MRLVWKAWGGIAPKIAERNLPDMMGQTARNVWLAPTALEPIKDTLDEHTLDSALDLSIYLWHRASATEWLEFLTDVNVVRGPIADDQYSRIYYTDGTTLHMKLWNSATSAKVEVDDVSKAQPAAPTITKADKFDPTKITAYFGTSGTYLTGQYRGCEMDGSIANVKFHFDPWQSDMPTLMLSLFWLTIQFKSGTSTESVTIPSVQTQDNQSLLFSTVTDLYQDNVKYGTIQVLSKATKSTDDDRILTSGLTSWTFKGMDVTFQCKLDILGRSSTQFQYYVQTTVDAYGQESPPSDISSQVEWKVNEKLTIQAAAAGTGISKIRLYRTAPGNVESDFFFLAEVEPGATYVDNKLDAELAEAMPLIENPPTALTGLVNVPGGFMCAFNGKDIYFSEPWLPYSWPTRYRLTVDFDVVGLAVTGNDVIVLTTGNPYYISGTHPEIMTQSKLPIEQSCVSKRSIAFSERYVCYASPDGLCTVSGGDVKVVTFPFYTKDQWTALTPSGIIGSVHEGRYIGFHSTGGFIMDFREPIAALSTTDEMTTGVYCDLETDNLYMIQSDKIVIWRGGTTSLLATWKSKKFQNVQDAIWSCAKIIADTYTNITFKIFADGTQVWSYTVTDSTGFRVPKFSRSAMWEISLETQDRICEVILASSMNLLRSGDNIKQ